MHAAGVRDQGAVQGQGGQGGDGEGQGAAGAGPQQRGGPGSVLLEGLVKLKAISPAAREMMMEIRIRIRGDLLDDLTGTWALV